MLHRHHMRGGRTHGIFAIWGGGHRGWGGRPDRGDGEGRGRRRMFDSGQLRLVLLSLIKEQPRHGYDLIREIEDRTGGAYAPSPGVIYPTLTLLEDMDFIDEAKADGTKKLFTITPAGVVHLEERADEVAAIFAKLSAMSAMRAKTDGAPIRRAMGNLRSALQNRLTQGDVSVDIQHQVAALLDEVAQKIERL